MLRPDLLAVPSTAVRTRVAFDVGPLIGPRSGIGAAVHELRRSLERLAEPPVVEPYVLSFRAALEPGITRLPFPAAVAHRAWAHVDRPRADRWLRHPDVVHGTNYVVPPAHSARVVTVYDCWFLRNPSDVHPDVARAGTVLRRAIRRGAVVHTSSEATAREVRELTGADRVSVVPLGALPLPSAPAHPPAAVAGLVGLPAIVALATVERRKNLPVLVAAFGLLAATDPDLVLVLAGAPGNDQAAVETAIGRLDPRVQRRVHVLGRVDDDTRSWLLHHARVIAYPSRDEGFGFPVLDGFAARVPVVASTAGSIPEVAGTAAALVGPDDVPALAAALLAAHLDEHHRRVLVAAGADRLAAYDWATTARSMADLYDALAMERAR